MWPFVTGFVAWGLFRYHNAPMGFAATMAVARTTFLWGLGANPEVFSGSAFEPLETAVPQQFFATSMLLTPLVRGLVGWEGDAPDHRVSLAPHLPPQWDALTVERLPVATGRYTVRFARTDTTLTTELTRTGGAGVDTLVFSPALPLGAVVRDVRANGRPVSLQCAVHRRGRARGLPSAARRAAGGGGPTRTGVGGTVAVAGTRAGRALAQHEDPVPASGG